MAEKAEKYLAKLKDNKIIPENDMRKLCKVVTEILIQEPNIVIRKGNVTFVGDIHG